MRQESSQSNSNVQAEMQLWSRLCGRSLSQERGEGNSNEATVPEASFVLNSDAGPSPMEDIASGRLALENYAVEVPPNAVPQPQTNVPWDTIRRFLDYVKQRRRRLRLRFTRKDRSVPKLPPCGYQEAGAAVAASAGTTNEAGEGVNEIELDCTDPPSPSAPCSMAASNSQISNESRPNVRTAMAEVGAVFLAEGHSSPRTDPISGERSSAAANLEAVGSARTEPQEEPVASSHPIVDGEFVHAIYETESRLSSERKRNPVAPGKEDSDDFCVSAGMIKNSAGEMKSEKVFYDTGSPNSWASQKLVDKHNLPTRPIRPEDLQIYDTIGGERVIPTDYVDIWLTDEHHGINRFTKESFNITTNMGGRGLLLGRAFMRKHGVMLDAKQGPGVYVTTARNASEAAKEAQRRLLAQREQDRQRALAIAASTVGSMTTATGNSQAEKAAPSSRTSISSGASKFQPPPKYS